MEIIKNRNREYRKVDTQEGIDRVLSKYVDFNNIFLKSNEALTQVKFLERQDQNRLLLNFTNSINSDIVSIFTLATRYIEFVLQVVESADDSYPENTYVLNVNKCQIAEDKRNFERTETWEWELRANHFVLYGVREAPAQIMGSISFQVFFHECERKLGEYEHAKFFNSKDADLTVEKKYVIETKSNIYINDLQETAGFFADNKEFFATKPDMKEALEKRLQELNEKYKSLLVRPINYTSLSGNEFPIGYIMVAASGKPIEADDLEKIDIITSETCSKIRDANQTVHDINGKVLNISPAGALIKLTDSEFTQKICSQNWLIFSLIFKLQQPIRISSEVIYAFKMSESSFLLGINFKGSGFGPDSKNIIEGHIRDSKDLQ